MCVLTHRIICFVLPSWRTKICIIITSSSPRKEKQGNSVTSEHCRTHCVHTASFNRVASHASHKRQPVNRVQCGFISSLIENSEQSVSRVWANYRTKKTKLLMSSGPASYSTAAAHRRCSRTLLPLTLASCFSYHRHDVGVVHMNESPASVCRSSTTVYTCPGVWYRLRHFVTANDLLRSCWIHQHYY